MSEAHQGGCPEDAFCRCGPTVRCTAVLVDVDGVAWRGIEDPAHGPEHESDDWAWRDRTHGVTYSVDEY